MQAANVQAANVLLCHSTARLQPCTPLSPSIAFAVAGWLAVGLHSPATLVLHELPHSTTFLHTHVPPPFTCICDWLAGCRCHILMLHLLATPWLHTLAASLTCICGAWLASCCTVLLLTNVPLPLSPAFLAAGCRYASSSCTSLVGSGWTPTSYSTKISRTCCRPPTNSRCAGRTYTCCAWRPTPRSHAG